MKYVAPSIYESAFNCPHCGALTTQDWCNTHADLLKENEKPTIVDASEIENFDYSSMGSQRQIEEIKEYLSKAASKMLFLEPSETYTRKHIVNLYVSRCYHCRDLAVWINDRLIHPVIGTAPEAAADMPTDVRLEYEEASTILHTSPRGAAALLRLAIQRLCKHLGGDGENINSDIGKLVSQGLDARIQQALDIVRVIGNNAVHPGQIDLRDDQATATTLFGLVNLITDRMISEPKRIADMYKSLPSGALDAISRRDNVAKNK